jgi:hypothetical protein
MLGLLLLAISSVQAQSAGNVTLRLVEDRRIGTDCPAASSLAPDGVNLWVLMHNCGDEDYYLLNFVVGTGSFDFDTRSGEHYEASLTGLEGVYVDGLLNNPLGIGADGSPQLQFYGTDGVMQGISPLNGSTAANSALTEQINATALYPEYAVPNADHSAVAVVGADGVYVFDSQTGSELLVITVDNSAALDTIYPQFSPDGKSLDLIIRNNPDNPDAIASTLYRYSIPDGELQLETELASPLAWPSPDGRYVLLWVGDDELVVIEPATGGISNFVHMYEQPSPVTECANGVNFDLSDSNFIWDGSLAPMGINWLPDSSGFVTINTYSGDGAQSDNNVCLYEESRLRLYAVGHEG